MSEEKVKKKVIKKDVKADAPKKEVKAEPAKEKTYAIRGNIFEGTVISAKADKTVTVQRVLTQYIQKYERYKKVKSKVKAHNPTSINAKEGDRVRIGETRKISKTKNFIIIEIIGDKKNPSGRDGTGQ